MAGRLARAWGFNGAGELGDGTTTEAAGPVQVTGLTNATQVAAGAWFSLAVRTMLGLLGHSRAASPGPAGRRSLDDYIVTLRS